MPQERFYVEVAGVKLHYLEYAGPGPRLVLVPGITSPAMVWGFVAERLASFAHVYVLDNRGRGLSDQRAGLAYTLDAYADDVAGLVRELELGAPIVLGHSMGGRIAIRLAARHPAACAGVVLADPPVSGPGRRPYPSPLQQYLDRIAAASRGVVPPPSGRPTPETPEQTRLRLEWLPTCSVEAVIASHRGFHEENVFADLARIACPALLLYAEFGGTITDDEAAEVVRALPFGSKQKLGGTGHMMPWFDLSTFTAAIRSFVEGNAVAAVGTPRHG